MGETPAQAQDVRPVWYRVAVASDNEHDDGWAVTHSGTATVSDLTGWLVGKGLEQHEVNESPVRVQVWDNPQCEGDPITEHYAPAESGPWNIPPAQMADPTPQTEELPQRTPEDVPPPLRAVPNIPPDDDTLTRVRDGLKGDQEKPGSAIPGTSGPTIVVMGPPDDADVPEGLRELFKAAKVNMERAAREAIREHRMIETAKEVEQAISDARQHAATAHVTTPWTECLQCLTLVALAASHFTAAYMLARTAD